MEHFFTVQVKHFLMIYFGLLAITEPTPASAQDTSPATQGVFSEKELKTFVEINKKVAEIEHTHEDKMIEAIKAEKLEVSRFNTLLQAQQNNDLENTEASVEELAAFHDASQKVQAIQQTMSIQITMYVERAMGVEKYKTIMHAYQQSPTVRDRINSILHY